MKHIAIFIAGIALGVIGAAIGIFVGEYALWPGGKRR